MYVLMLIISMFGCADELLRYRCTCTQFAFGAGENGENIDDSFSEVICETKEVMDNKFSSSGEITNAVKTCQNKLSQLSNDYECDCECDYLEPCD